MGIIRSLFARFLFRFRRREDDEKRLQRNETELCRMGQDSRERSEVNHNELTSERIRKGCEQNSVERKREEDHDEARGVQTQASALHTPLRESVASCSISPMQDSASKGPAPSHRNPARSLPKHGIFLPSPPSDIKPFKAIIHSGELFQIRQWVSKFPKLETGGDLFGLWSKDGSVVVQFVLGPGGQSKRTSVSFFQNSKYLLNAGTAITEDYGLCHIGEWHSHHTLDLPRPSSGDQATVRDNMPTYGWKRFVVFIAHIDASRDFGIGLCCFLFEAEDTVNWKRVEMRQGEFQILPGQSPLRRYAFNDASFRKVIQDGAESINEAGEITEENGLL